MDYANGKIYKLVNCVNDYIYIGSTTSTLVKRKAGHVNKAQYHPSRFIYKNLLPIGWKNIRIILIEAYPCKNKDELTAREQHWIDKLKPYLNTDRAVETIEQYRDRKKNKDNTYYQNNKEKWVYTEAMSKRNKEKVKCECGSILARKSLSRHRNCDEHQSWVRETGYIPPQKKLINWKENVTCECGVTLKREAVNCKRHKNTKIHREYQELYDYIYS